MLRIGVRELRQNASRYLAKVKAGETIEVTERGVLVARLVPLQTSESAGLGSSPRGNSSRPMVRGTSRRR